MPDLQPLTNLLANHERERDAALAEVQRARTASVAAAEQAAQLRAYRVEYEQRWAAQFGREASIELVRCYHSFMERLTQAVEQQAAQAQHAAQRVETAQAALRDAELRCASVGRLIERRMLEHRRDHERRDQKHTDEFAARAAWSGRARPRPF